MERKNMVLLTVIAVATLLVAVVGATFAYFTASIQTSGTQENATTTVTTKSTVASVTMDYGNKITVPENGVLPGWKAVKTLVAKGQAESEDADPVTANIVLTPTVTDFPEHVKYTVYHQSSTQAASSPVESICTESKPENNGEKLYDAMTCEVSKMGTKYESYEGTFTDSTPVKIPVTIAHDTDETYYVLIEYVNDPSEQDDEQGKTFTVAMSFELAAKAD